MSDRSQSDSDLIGPILLKGIHLAVSDAGFRGMSSCHPVQARYDLESDQSGASPAQGEEVAERQRGLVIVPINRVSSSGYLGRRSHVLDLAPVQRSHHLSSTGQCNYSSIASAVRHETAS
jgi:hypothetical protein